MSVSPSTGFPLEEEYKKNTGITPWEIAELRSWLETQTHMPSDVITDLDLILAHHSCKRNPEQTKQVLELHYTLKTQYSFFQNRTLDDEVELTLKRMSVLMVLDLWQYLEGTWPGLVIIFDLEGFRLSHMFRLELQIVQQFLHYLEHAMLVQLKGIHLMNAPFFANRLLMILKRFVGSEMMHLVNTHTAGSNTLAEYVDVEILPKEAGGSFRSVEECRDDTIAMMKENKDFFLQENKKRVTESLRPKKSQNKKKPEKFLNID
ncbi:uncharacterized protein LOC101746971 isoform X2 [Bombyx mori]|uniref:uncharacterized protein LOC101746971 isoform X2 n=1 Tax=Bombyx mori TaxID=7091 RepID=UPI002ECFD9BB